MRPTKGRGENAPNEQDEHVLTDPPARVAANRNNAARSTGPKTPAGKERSRRNALKHGLLAKEVVIQTGEGAESITEFHNLIRSLRDELRPIGPVEELLVERVATCYWRLRRALRAEVGEIRKGLDCASADDDENRLDEVEQLIAMLPVAAATGNIKETLRALQRSSFGLDYLIGVLDEVREHVEMEGQLSKESSSLLARTFGTGKGDLWFWGIAFGSETPPDPDFEGDALTPDQEKAVILGLLEEYRSAFEQARKVAAEREALQREARLAALALPEAGTSDKILRYETTIERQMYRALNQLDKLQRQRRGEAVPPLLRVDVDHGD